MLLAIDIGNTQIHLGVFHMKDTRISKDLHKSWRISTRKEISSDELGIKIMNLFDYADIEPLHTKGIIVASVVPPLDAILTEVCEKYFQLDPLFVGPGIKTGINILYENPKEVGADRIVNAVAAHEHVKKTCIVVDFGTATTFDCISSQGEYMGGVIAPGPEMAAQALFSRTSKLPLLDTFDAPQSALGKTTLDSLKSGFFYGYKGLIQEILSSLKKEMQGDPVILATGGLAKIWASSIKDIKQIYPNLTLEGLRTLWYINKA